MLFARGFRVIPRLRFIQAALILSGSLLLIHLALTFAYHGNLPVRITISDLAILTVDSLAAAGLLFAARRSASRGRGALIAWTVLAAGQSGRAIGDLAVLFREVGLHQTAVPPSGDVLFVAVDSLFVLGLVLLAGWDRSSGDRLRKVIDTGIVMIAALLVSWTMVILPRVADGQLDSFVLFTPVAYAVVDVLLIFAVIDLIFDRHLSKSRVPILLLAGGALAKVAAGLAALVLCPPDGACLSGDWDASIWVISAIMIGLGGALQAVLPFSRVLEDKTASGEREATSNYKVYFSYLWVIAAYLLLVLNFGQIPTIGFSILLWGTGAIICLVILRQVLVLNENRQLVVATRQEVVERRRGETEIKRLNQELEKRVIARTAQLETANRELQNEIAERRRAEEALGLERNLLRTLIDTVPDYLYVKDTESRFVVSNLATARSFGNGLPESLYGKCDSELFAPDLAAGFMADEQGVLSSGQPLVNREEYVVESSGNLKWLITTKVPLRDNQGKIIGLVGVGRDISERRKAEEAQANLAAIVESSDDAMIGKNLDGIIITWNAAAERMYGYAWEEIKGRSISILAPPDRQGETEEILERIKRGERLQHFETERIRKDGSPVQVSLTVSAIKDGEGKITGASTIARDITERKRMEAELQESNKKLTVWVNQLEQSSREIEQLSQMGDRLQSCRNADEAYQVISHSGRSLFPAESGALFVLNNSRNLIEMAAAWGESRPRERTFSPDDCWGLRRGRPYVVEEAESDVLCAHLGKDIPAGYLCIPMMAQGETIGVLHLRSDRPVVGEAGRGEDGGRHFTVSKQQLAGTVAEHIALSLASLQLRETLRSQAIRDPLTGLFNRRYMEETIERELHRAERNGTPLGVIMFDIDHFKQFNDNFGHGAGDAILRELGTFIEGKMRREDIACRYGGDEFILVLPECSIETTYKRAEQFRLEFKDQNVTFHRQSLPMVSLSMGVAASSPHGTNAEVLLRRADQALYRAKADGRDRVVAADCPEGVPLVNEPR